MVKWLPYILLAVAFVVLLMTLYPYYQIKKAKIQDYRCPDTEWVDCEPAPGTFKAQCQSDYLDWATKNCPGFRGAAL